MKFISWNVNGIRACLQKGFLDFFQAEDADIFCIQETKMQIGQAEVTTPGYFQYWNSAIKKGYSGTAIFTKKEPIQVMYDINHPDHFGEGRVITLEYQDFYIVNVYTPNSKPELARLEYRMQWEDDFKDYLNGLKTNKAVILCGDLNVAHTEIDLKNPKTNRKSAGFSDEERAKFTALLGNGYIDTFRNKYPDTLDAYTWWSYMFQARTKNVGWRIDYFVVSENAREAIVDATIYPEVLGSDHCPVGLVVNAGLQW